jgi:NifB/MoaA-like Fe-S oxidoreductase
VTTRYRTRLRVIGVENTFFGEEVTVAGLLAGSDVLKARDEVRGNFLIVPEQACLKSSHVFLDDLTVEDLEKELELPVSHGGPSFQTMLESATSLEQRGLA